MQLPIVSRNRLLKQELAFKSKSARYKQQIIDLQEKLTLAEREMKEILPRLVTLHEPIPSEFNTYRICVDLHRDMIERVFIHGDDAQMIGYIAHLLAREIEAKMTTFNFIRR